MKKLLFLLLLIPFLGNSQATFTAPVGYNTGAPTATPSGVGTRWRFDLLTGKKYTWLPGSLSWDEDARGIDQVAGCSAPLYTPGYNQSTFAVNSCTVPELYQWTGAAWVRLNEGEVYTAGTGISISGGNEISNTAPDQTVTMTDGTGIDVTGTYPNFTVTNTSPNVVQTLSIAGQDLSLSGGGGTVAIPGGVSDALGTGFVDGGGSGSIPDGTVATIGTNSFRFGNISTFLTDIGSAIGSYSTSQNFELTGYNDGADGQFGHFFSGKLDDAESKTTYDAYGFKVESSADAGATLNKLYVLGDGIEITAQTGFFKVFGNGVVLPNLTTAQRNALTGVSTGTTIYNTNATATDSSTGVMQVWNGSVWKNAW